MKKGKYLNTRSAKRASKKLIALALALVLTIGGVVGGTVAWLTAQTSEVENTFSTSNIGVELKETTTEYKMVPGWNITKDPKAWVTDGSEAAYLFVKIEESGNFDDFMTYAIAEGWKLLDGTEAASINTDTKDTYVIYREVATTEMGESNASAILMGDKVTVKENVTKEAMNALTDETRPTLTFQAAAVQLYKGNNEKFSAADACAKVVWSTPTSTPATP